MKYITKNKKMSKQFNFIIHPKVIIRTKEKRMTITGVYNEKDQTMSVGKALCGCKDNFSRKLGRTIARGRAIKHSDVDSLHGIPSFEDAKKLFYEQVVPGQLKSLNAERITEESNKRKKIMCKP